MGLKLSYKLSIFTLTLGAILIFVAPTSMASTVVLNMDTDPQLVPGWEVALNDSNPGSHSVSGSVLTINSPNFYEFFGYHPSLNPNGAWEPVVSSSDSWVVEARMRLDASSGPSFASGARIWMNSNPNLWIFDVFTDRVRLANSDYFMDTMSDFHVYRIEAVGSTASLYVDNILALTSNTPGSGATAFFFGDGDGSSTSVSSWDYVSFSTVPVPAAFWLFSSGLIGLIGVARRKKA